MADTQTFAWLLLLTAVVGLVALLSNQVTRWIRIPASALLLVVAAVAVHAIPSLEAPPDESVERMVTVALAFILFEGGMSIGVPRFRNQARTIALVGVLGT